MPQSLMFYKLTCLSEKATENLPFSNVYESVKSLFKVNDHIVLEMIDTYFENIIMNYLHINYEELVRTEADYIETLNYIFNPELYPFFMVSAKDWLAIEGVIKTRVQSIIQANENDNTSTSLNQVHLIMKDYSNLSSLRQKNLLFAQIDC